MPYCQKCGFEVSEDMAFCTKCGSRLKVEADYKAEKAEKAEKREKEEKGEKTEKYEKREVGVIGPLIGGLILILMGLMFYLAVTGYLRWLDIWPFFLIIIGIMVIVGVIYGATTAARRHPKP